MAATIFYAWQSDRPANVCRYLIRDATKHAIKKLKAEVELKPAPSFNLDEATKGLTGHPHIASAIRKKIKACDVFLGDLTHVADYKSADGRAKRIQNANVLIELGMAIRSKGFGRLILVMNDAYGSPEDLPFDLKSHSFPIVFTLPAGADETAIEAVKQTLATRIYDKLKPMLTAIHEDAAKKLKAAEEALTKVDVTCQMALAGVPGTSGKTVSFVSITAVNTGSRPVTISQAGLILSDGLYFTQPSTQLFGRWKLPKRLEESDTVDVMFEVFGLYERMVDSRLAGKPFTVVRAVVRDTAGKVYQSNELQGYTEEAMKQTLS